MNRIMWPLVLALAMVAALPAQAQWNPARPIRIVVPYPPGGTTDVLGRVAAERLAERWKQPVIVENRPGATGNIGADLVAKSAPDGYTLLVMPLDIAINPALYKNLPYDARKDLAPVTALAFSGLVIMRAAAPSLTGLQWRSLTGWATRLLALTASGLNSLRNWA